MSTEIRIKGMVCRRCIDVVAEGIQKLGYEVELLRLGRLLLHSPVQPVDYTRIERFLQDNGFEMTSTRHVRTVQQAKDLISGLFKNPKGIDRKVKLSSFLSESLSMGYETISELFTALEGVTPEQYMIAKRLEKVKELLVYTDITLTEISHLTGFGGINHMSRQFKELTGFAPSHFRKVRASKQQFASGNL